MSALTPSLIQNVRNLSVLPEFSPKDKAAATAQAQHYLRHVGRASLLNVYNLLNIRAGYLAKDMPVRNILDYGCNHGRFTRWLRAAFPQARIHVADTDKSSVAWCVQKYDCRPVYKQVPAGTFDLVWAGSAFAHRPEHVAGPMLDELLHALRMGGVLALSSHGRARIERMKDFEWGKDDRSWLHFGLPREAFEQVVAGYNEYGYGYADFPEHDQKGVAIVSPSWYSERAFGKREFTQILLQEKADGTMDLSAFMRLDIAQTTLGPLWQPPAA